LVSDGDIEGVAVRLAGSLAVIEEDPLEDAVINAGAGASISELLDCCRKAGYGGLEFLSGIPGSVGGAAVMNAGAFGKDTVSVIHGMEMVTSAGERVPVNRDELSYGYRHLQLKEGAVVTRVGIRTEKKPPREVANRIADYLKRRRKTQPLEHPSAGSVFKNPPGDYAGRLIEAAGLKGMRRGGAMISDKHANWIVNTGEAGSGDILELIRLTRKIVREKMGVALELEVRLIGL
jgi:UDP-N-acetylmuramate dehydrogenase